MPAAKPVCPAPNWLTPGAESATASTLRVGPSGNSDKRRESNCVETSALLVLMSAAFSVTLTTSCHTTGLHRNVHNRILVKNQRDSCLDVLGKTCGFDRNFIGADR